jgi:3-hydroxyisobutyrate dehydrogenase
MAAVSPRLAMTFTPWPAPPAALDRPGAGCRIAASAGVWAGRDRHHHAARRGRAAGCGPRLSSGRPPGGLSIGYSTIDVDSSRAVSAAALAAGKDLRAADAPVSGGIMAADAGTLAFMVGCETEQFPAVEAILTPMARAVIHAGAAGAGQAAKICNNMLLGISMLGVCEAFALAEKLGLDPLRFFDIASKSSGQCWSLTSYSPWPGPVPSAPSNRGYEGGFLTSLMSKDLKLAQEAAAKAGATTPLGSEAQAIYALFEALGYGQKDFSAVLQLMRGRLADL